MNRIELRDRSKKIIGYCTVSPEHYDQLNQFKWHKSRGYAVKNSNDGTSTLMHRYIMIEILGHKELTTSNDLVVHHIDCDRSNNTEENLEWATRSENAQKKSKSENASSDYYGVSEIIKKLKVTYRVQFRVDENTNLYACYDNEIHAAHQFNLWYEKYGRTDNRRNDIEIPDNFVEWIKTKKKDTDLPTGIWRRGDKFCIQPIINGKCVYSSYNSLEKAQLELNRILHEEEIRKLKMIFIAPIVKNKEHQCVIELFNIKREKVGETIVDEDIYYLLKMFPIHLSEGRANITVNGKKMKLSRYIMNYHGVNYVDHRNRNPLDNRICNLRILTPLQNSWNQSPAKNSLSGYIGVYKNGEKWIAKIKVEGKHIHLGTFPTKIEAAKKRDVATKEHYGEFGYLNFPEIL